MTPPNTRRPAVERAFKALTGEKPRELGRQPIKSEETDLVLLRGASCSARSFKGDSSRLVGSAGAADLSTGPAGTCFALYCSHLAIFSCRCCLP